MVVVMMVRLDVFVIIAGKSHKEKSDGISYNGEMKEEAESKLQSLLPEHQSRASLTTRLVVPESYKGNVVTISLMNGNY